MMKGDHGPTKLLHVYACIYAVNQRWHNILNTCTIIESVDSISRDGPDTPIYIIHYKKRNNSEQENFN